jgi:hypothetical protein
MFEAFPLTLNLPSCRCTLEHILAYLGIPVAASDSPARADSCSDRIIGIDSPS